jgi:hypothetical protein
VGKWWYLENFLKNFNNISISLIRYKGKGGVVFMIIKTIIGQNAVNKRQFKMMGKGENREVYEIDFQITFLGFKLVRALEGIQEENGAVYEMRPMSNDDAKRILIECMSSEYTYKVFNEPIDDGNDEENE